MSTIDKAQRKVIKCQFNSLYTGTLAVEKDAAFMCAGLKKDNLIEVTSNGINIQPGTGKSVAIQSLYIRQPMFKNQDPFLASITAGPLSLPQYTLDIPFQDSFKDIAVLIGAFTALQMA